LTLSGDGSGKLVLSGINNYVGGTVVSGGTLQLGNASALPNGPLTMNAGVLDFNSNSVTVSLLSGTGGIITDNSAGNSNVFTVDQSSNSTFSGSLQNGSSVKLGVLLSGAGALTLSGTNTNTGGMTVQDGALILDGAASLMAGSSLTIGINPSPGAIFAPPAVTPTAPAPMALAPVPEPGTLALLAIASIAGLGFTRRRLFAYFKSRI
jgi:autotransporter-associated beta strand protein